MRVGNFVRETNINSAEIILDWPEQKQPRHIYDEEYNSALIYGTTCEKQDYHCGELKKIGFSDSIFFTSMKMCPLLQFSDLGVGATREFIDLALEKDEVKFGFDCLKKLRMKFRGYPENIIGRGLVIAPTTGELKNKVTQFLPKLYK